MTPLQSSQRLTATDGLETCACHNTRDTLLRLQDNLLDNDSYGSKDIKIEAGDW